MFRKRNKARELSSSLRSTDAASPSSAAQTSPTSLHAVAAVGSPKIHGADRNQPILTGPHLVHSHQHQHAKITDATASHPLVATGSEGAPAVAISNITTYPHDPPTPHRGHNHGEPITRQDQAEITPYRSSPDLGHRAHSPVLDEDDIELQQFAQGRVMDSIGRSDPQAEGILSSSSGPGVGSSKRAGGTRGVGRGEAEGVPAHDAKGIVQLLQGVDVCTKCNRHAGFFRKLYSCK